MALSGTITATMTAQALVDTAMELIGVTAIGDSSAGENGALGLKHLGVMLKTWQMAGVCDGWRREDIEMPWPANTATATLDINYLDLDNLRTRDDDDTDFTLTPLSAQEYAEISDKFAVGTAVQYNIRKIRCTLALSLWPVPDVDTTLFADGARVMQDVTALTQDVDIPQEWLEAAFYALAARLLLPMGIFTTDPNRAAKIEERAAALYSQAKSFDEETGSIFFALPDPEN